MQLNMFWAEEHWICFTSGVDVHICGLYLGVWASVKRRLWRLMLRFISSFRNSRGEFLGDARGESLGDISGDPPGEPVLDLGLSWMTGLVALGSCGFTSTSVVSSSELSERISIMATIRSSAPLPTRRSTTTTSRRLWLPARWRFLWLWFDSHLLTAEHVHEHSWNEIKESRDVKNTDEIAGCLCVDPCMSSSF